MLVNVCGRTVRQRALRHVAHHLWCSLRSERIGVCQQSAKNNMKTYRNTYMQILLSRSLVLCANIHMKSLCSVSKRVKEGYSDICI